MGNINIKTIDLGIYLFFSAELYYHTDSRW